MLIATKARFPMGEGPNDRGLSRWHLIRECEASLKRLRTDVIDLYQVHQWDGLTPLEETMEALDSLVRSGKVRYVGCSNFSGWHIMKAMEVARRDGRVPFVSEQIHYTLQARDAEYELIPIAIDQKLGVLVWSPLAGGLLSGKHRRDKTAEGSRFMAGWKEPPVRDENALWAIVDELVAIGEAHKVSAAQVALAWLLDRPAVTSLIIGGRTEAQFRDNLACVNVKLADDERARLDKASLPPLLYPYWHQSWTAKDRFGPADLALHAPYLWMDREAPSWNARNTPPSLQAAACRSARLLKRLGLVRRRLVAFVVRIDGSSGKPAFGLGVRDIFERRLFVPRATRVLALREIEHEFDSFVRRDVAKEGIIQLAHLIEGLHEHIRVGDLTREKVMERLFGAFVVARFDQRLRRSDARRPRLRCSPGGRGQRCRPLECKPPSSSCLDCPGNAGRRP